MNFILGLLFGFLLGDRKTGSGLPLPTPGGGSPFPFPFPVPGGSTGPGVPGGLPPTGKTPPMAQTGLPGVLPGLIPASWPWGQPAPAGTPPPPEGGPVVPWLPPTTTAVPVPAARTYVLRSGDYGSGLAKKATGDAGRWKELLAANPEMSTYTDSKGQTQIKPWKVGQKIVVPPGWNL